MRTSESKIIYPGGDFPTHTSGELRHMVVRRIYSSEEQYRRIMAEITRSERLGVDDVANMNAVPRRRSK